MALTIVQLLPEMEVGGVEQGTVEIAQALVARGHRALVVSAGGRLVSRLEAIGAEHVLLPIGRKRVSTLFLVRKLRELLLAESVDLVHARSRLPAWIGHLALNKIEAVRRPRWVTTVHGPYAVNRYSQIMVSGARVIAISEFIRDYIFESYPDTPHDRVEVIPRGVDDAIYSPEFVPAANWRAQWDREHPALHGKRFLCLPARLTRWKGQQEFIQLVARLVADKLPVHGLIVGGPHPHKREFADELKQLVRQLDLERAITFVGQRADLREILCLCDCVFSLTREPEAFGRTTLEALSLGRPVIGYDHGGTGEILRQVFPRGLVPTGNVALVAERCREFLAQPPRVPASHPYQLARMQAATVNLYEALVSGPRPT